MKLGVEYQNLGRRKKKKIDDRLRKKNPRGRDHSSGRASLVEEEERKVIGLQLKASRQVSYSWGE